MLIRTWKGCFWGVALSAQLVLPTASAAESLAGSVMSGGPGQPVCDTSEHLQEYVQAEIARDAQWMASLPACSSLAEGSKIAVIAVLPNSSPLGHVVKIRVFGKHGSLVGYTLSVGLQPRR